MNRKLGSSEYIAWLSDRVGSLNFVTVAHISGDVNEQILRDGLDLLPQYHPLLKTQIDIQEGKPVFVSDHVPDIPLRVEIRHSDEHWHNETEKEMNAQFSSSTGPLVRVVLLKGTPRSDLLVTFHHAIGDAASGLYFVLHLLKIVEQLSRNQNPVIEPFPEHPPVEDLLPESAQHLRGLAKTGALIGKQVMSIVVQHPQKLPKDGDLFAKDRTAHFIHHLFSEEETELLIKKCHSESTTVHGAISAAVLRAVAHQLFNAHDSESATVGCMSAVDLRSFLNPSIGEEIGFYVSMVITAHRIPSDISFWDLARNVRKAVHHSIESGDHFVFISLLDKLLKTTSPEDFMKRALTLYPAALLMTNVGRLDMPEQYGPLNLEGLHFTLANIAASEHFNTAIATFRNRLVINFSYTEPTMSPDRAHSLTDDVIGILAKILSDHE
ncbi:MAG: hypothetical protein HXS44_10965 [Theionarchaea archaeon]|nr:hypothetical protein [Theionarchaea archaeon]